MIIYVLFTSELIRGRIDTYYLAWVLIVWTVGALLIMGVGGTLGLALVRPERPLVKMEREPVVAAKLPGTLGPYSHAVVAGPFVFVSGLIPIDPETGEIISEDIREATRLVFESAKEILRVSGSSLEDVVRVTVYVRDLKYIIPINSIFEAYYPTYRPARTLVEVTNLPRGAPMEIDFLAVTRRPRASVRT